MRPMGCALTSLLVAVSTDSAGPAQAAQGEEPAVAARCPATTEQAKDLRDPNSPGPSHPVAAQPAEKSAILPSAPGDTPSSSAATVQQKGESVASALDCDLTPGHPNELEK